MINSLNVRAFNNQAPALAVRQRVAVSKGKFLPWLLERNCLVPLSLVVIVAISVCQLMAGITENLQAEVERQRQAYAGIQEENISLRASRAALMSKGHVASLAAGDLQLFAPSKEQVHRIN